MITLEHIIIALFVIWLIWFNYVANTEWIKTGPIKQQKFELHSSQGAYGGVKGKKDRFYIIVGGSGFKGSWIARYLLARGEENITLLDRERPHADLIKHGVVYIHIDLTQMSAVERELGKISAVTFERCRVIVYNCSMVKQLGLPNFRADLGVHAAEILFVALSLFQHRQVYLIHLGDTLSHRHAVRNWDRVWPTAEIWSQTAASDLSTGFGPSAESREDQRDSSFSSYAWHQLHVETMTSRASIINPCIAASATLRIEGFTSGHLGDGLLSPLLRSGYIFLHAPNVPISIVNIEDVARGCLSLEHLLMDPSTRDKVNGRQFTVGSSEITTWKHIFEYCKRRRPSFRIIPTPPALVYLATWIMGFIYTGKPSPWKQSRDTPFGISLPRLTFSRFYTLQVGQVPNPQNQERQEEVLHLQNNFSLSQTLDGILDELEIVTQQQQQKRR